VILTSGGPASRWRRKRNKAARLHPMAEDASSTTQLFDGRLRRPRPQAVPEPTPPPSLPPGVAAYQPLPSEPVPGEPLVRYEWRTAAGDVLVVEAAWPTRPTPDAASTSNGTNGHRSDEPHVDLRPPDRPEPTTVVRLESPGA
jgi:hypothetical protein